MRTITIAAFAFVALLSISFVMPDDALAQIILDGGDDDGGDTQRRRRHRTRTAVECEDGKVDVKGTCCWEGQTSKRGSCSGIPTSCPAGMVVDAREETCGLASCKDGMMRADDGVHCCWANQVWSASADACKGVPTCPSGTLAMGEQCIADADGDKIVGADDACPTEAEDKDNFEDADGCPDPDNDMDGVCDPWVANSGKTFPECKGRDMCENATAPGSPDGCVQGAEVIPPELPEESSGGPSVWSWVAMGAGVALAGSGVALHFVAEGTRDEVRSAFTSDGTPVTTMTRADALTKEADANSLDTTGAVLIGVGAAAIAGGATLMLLTWPSESDEASASVFVTPQGDWLISVGGRF